MATSVLLHVTASPEVDWESGPEQPPAEVVRALERAGQSTSHGMSKHGQGPWRFRFQVTGPDKVALGRTLEAELRALGYETDVSFSP